MLVGANKKSTRRLEQALAENRSLKQKIRRMTGRLQPKPCADPNECGDDSGDKDLLALERARGGKGKYLTFSGAMSLAIRRNMSNCSQEDIGAVLLEDISRWSVSRAETRCGTALIASSRLWFASLYQELTSPISSTVENFRVCFYSFLEDGTNSGILKGSKLGGLILRAAYLRSPENLPNVDGEVDWNSFQIYDWMETIVRVADVLPVRSGTSEATCSQTLKQLRGLGCPTWKELQSDPALNSECLAGIIEPLDLPRFYNLFLDYFHVMCMCIVQMSTVSNVLRL